MYAKGNEGPLQIEYCYVQNAVIILGRGPDMTLVHPPHILANLYFFEPLGCPEYEIGL